MYRTAGVDGVSVQFGRQAEEAERATVPTASQLQHLLIEVVSSAALGARQSSGVVSVLCQAPDSNNKQQWYARQ